MKVGYKMFIVLTAISLLSGGLLSAWNSVTAPRIAEHRMNEMRLAIKEVLPPYDYYDVLSKDQWTLYIGKKENEPEPVGVAFRIVGNGFQGPISMMIGVRSDFNRITGLKILEQGETPGLGSKILEDPSNKEQPLWFTQQFKGLDLFPKIMVIKNAEPTHTFEIQAISGATISSKAIAEIINSQTKSAKSAYKSYKN